MGVVLGRQSRRVGDKPRTLCENGTVVGTIEKYYTNVTKKLDDLYSGRGPVRALLDVLSDA